MLRQSHMITFILQGSSPPHPQKKEISPKCCAPKSHKNPGVGKHIWENSPKKESFFGGLPSMQLGTQHNSFRQIQEGKGLPRPAKRRLCPAPPRENYQNLQQGKVDFNPLKFVRLLRGRIQFIPINICLTHKSVDVHTSTE